MLACHAGGPGSIPGRCKLFLMFWQTQSWGKSFGGAGYRSRYLSHAKRALYHLSYAPVIPQIMLSLKFQQFRRYELSCFKSCFARRKLHMYNNITFTECYLIASTYVYLFTFDQNRILLYCLLMYLLVSSKELTFIAVLIFS